MAERLREFRLPDLGEGLTEGEILGWMVAEGDTITLNQPIVEVETAKAAVEVPSPFAGQVVKLHHTAGETVDVGATIITVDTDPAAGPRRAVGPPSSSGTDPAAPPPPGGPGRRSRPPRSPRAVGRWRSRRSASWPASSGSTSARSPGPGPAA